VLVRCPPPCSCCLVALSARWDGGTRLRRVSRQANPKEARTEAQRADPARAGHLRLATCSPGASCELAVVKKVRNGHWFVAMGAQAPRADLGAPRVAVLAPLLA